ncbi:class F sortase [Ornithinimicrobium sp. F0845]|uniref:class F sortase n=1 Tax=Ornithinimicrobium sp. F0845 TaxID=2926412 RepID=UPI001FF42A50|nr:class F sortase [Ornithinimicrobium sp. F0845]MCK0113327.1 class F sortase [Ornithinimicrobium sp. F0845]
MRSRAVVRAVALLACLALFAAGGVLVYRGLQEEPPAPTPTPDQEFSISLEEALETDRATADEPIVIPEGIDLGPYVNTEPVTVPPAPDAGDGRPGGDAGDGSGPGSGQGTAPELDPANHLYIPSIYVSAPVVPQGVTSSNEMSLPTDLRQVGLLDTTSPLGADEGSTLVAGHVTQQGNHGALYFLGRLRPGASVTTVDAEGAHTTWAVTSVRNYRKTSLPPEIFADTGTRMLTLVTCGGPIIRTSDGRWTHTDNIVVIARPVP